MFVDSAHDAEAAAAVGASTQQHNCFGVTKEVPLTSDIVLQSWCPTSDLCVVATSDGQLCLHRMDWQLLWAISPEVRALACAAVCTAAGRAAAWGASTRARAAMRAATHAPCAPTSPLQAAVTALCWSPDGKTVALGHASGALSLLDVESGAVVAEHKAHYAAITCLHWSERSAADAPPCPAARAATKALQQPRGQRQQGSILAPQHGIQPHERFRRLFVPPELAPLSITAGADALPDPYALCMEAAGAAAWPPQHAGMALLCAGDARGGVSLWLHGQVQVAEIQGGPPPPPSSEADAGGAAGGPHKLLHVSWVSLLCRGCAGEARRCCGCGCR
jgi:anaphase-promoting complex subunit 4